MSSLNQPSAFDIAGNPLCLTSLNCVSVEDKLRFYVNILGLVEIRRPESLGVPGAWLFGHGVGIHLLHSPEKFLKKSGINPRDPHISFQCENIDIVENKLTEIKIEFLKVVVEEKGIQVDQLFFHDPDGFMIEVCSCDRLPVVPLP